MKKIIFILFIGLGFLNAQNIAFPNAIGAGAEFNDWSNATVLHVTSLNDSNENEVGTLRWALLNSSNRTLDRIIVFDVSGVIDLQSRLRGHTADGNNPQYTGSVYVAGQTAPDGGITIIGDFLELSGFNTVFRYVKFRSDNGQSKNTMLGTGRGDYNIIDHCSFAYHSANKSSASIGIRDTTNPSEFTNGTFSNNLMGQNTLGFITGESTPSSSDVSGNITVARNVYYNISHRLPLKGGGSINVDAVNNIVHNWSSRLIRMDGWAYKLNHFKNYYQAGGNTTNQLKWASYLSSTGNPQIYTEDNFLEDDPRGNYSKPTNFDSDESVAWTEFQNNFVNLPSSYFTNTQHTILGQPFTILDNAQLIDSLLPEVGACKYFDNSGNVQFQRDIYDQEFVDGVENNSSSQRNTNTTFPLSVNSTTRPNDFYGTNKNIPSAWLTANGYINSSSVHTATGVTGYTVMEEYINQVDETPPVINIPQITRTDSNPTSIVQGGTYTPPTGTWTDAEDGTGSATVGGDTVDVNTVGSYNVTLSHTDTDGNTGTLTIVYTITSAVINVTDVTVSPKTLSIQVGQSSTINETILPIDATDKTGVWSSSNGAVATVSQNGLVTGLSVGTSNITYVTNDGDFSDNCVITVIEQIVVVGGKQSKKPKIILINN